MTVSWKTKNCNFTWFVCFGNFCFRTSSSMSWTSWYELVEPHYYGGRRKNEVVLRAVKTQTKIDVTEQGIPVSLYLSKHNLSSSDEHNLLIGKSCFLSLFINTKSPTSFKLQNEPQNNISLLFEDTWTQKTHGMNAYTSQFTTQKYSHVSLKGVHCNVPEYLRKHLDDTDHE